MRNQVLAVGLAVAAVVALPSFIHAQIERSAVGGVETIQCNGQSVDVKGTSYNLTLLGECPDVDVSGTGNVVKIERAGRIKVTGVNNRVVWMESLQGDRPTIAQTGLGNSVKHGAFEAPKEKAEGGAVVATSGQSVTLKGSGGSATISARTSGSESAATQSAAATKGKTIVLEQNHEQKTIECQGESVEVNGNFIELTLTGQCGKVSVNGNKNDVTIDATAAISVLGNGNTVSWRQGIDGKDPKLSNLGTGNEVTHSSE
jgi:hypothetical protein